MKFSFVIPEKSPNSPKSKLSSFIKFASNTPSSPRKSPTQYYPSSPRKSPTHKMNTTMGFTELANHTFQSALKEANNDTSNEEYNEKTAPLISLKIPKNFNNKENLEIVKENSVFFKDSGNISNFYKIFDENAFKKDFETIFFPDSTVNNKNDKNFIIFGEERTQDAAISRIDSLKYLFLNKIGRKLFNDYKKKILMEISLHEVFIEDKGYNTIFSHIEIDSYSKFDELIFFYQDVLVTKNVLFQIEFTVNQQIHKLQALYLKGNYEFQSLIIKRQNKKFFNEFLKEFHENLHIVFECFFLKESDQIKICFEKMEEYCQNSAYLLNNKGDLKDNKIRKLEYELRSLKEKILVYQEVFKLINERSEFEGNLPLTQHSLINEIIFSYFLSFY